MTDELSWKRGFEVGFAYTLKSDLEALNMDSGDVEHVVIHTGIPRPTDQEIGWMEEAVDRIRKRQDETRRFGGEVA